jgi:hypothetical protein
MNDTVERPGWRSGWIIVALVVLAVLAVLGYVSTSASHRAGTAATYKKLVDFVTHAQSVPPPAASVPERRHMDEQLESDLRSFVPSDTKLTITAISGDTEALAFAQEIAAWLRANGWQRVQGVNQREPTEKEHIFGTNLRVNPKGGMELVVGPRPVSTPATATP